MRFRFCSSVSSGLGRPAAGLFLVLVAEMSLNSIMEFCASSVVGTQNETTTDASSAATGMSPTAEGDAVVKPPPKDDSAADSPPPGDDSAANAPPPDPSMDEWLKKLRAGDKECVSDPDSHPPRMTAPLPASCAG